MNEIIKKFFAFSIGPLVGTIFSLITVPLTTYFISPIEYGKASMFTVVQSIITMIIYFGLDQAFVNFFYSVKDKKKLLTNSLLIPILISMFMMIMFFVFSKNISCFLFETTYYTSSIYMLAISMPLIIFERFILLQLRMKEWALRYSLFNLMIKAITFLSTFCFIMFIRRDFLAIVYSSIIGQILSDIILVIIYHRFINIDLKLIDRDLIKRLCHYGLPLVLVSFMGWGLNSMDRVWLKYLSTYEEIGYYAAAMKVCNMLVIIQTCFTTFWTPVAYRWNNDNVEKSNFTLIMRIVSCIMSLLFLCILICKGLLLLLLSDSYRSAIPIFPFLLFYPMMYTISETTVLGIDFTRKSYLNIIVSLFSIASNTVLNTVLIPIYGARGAAIATGISYIVFFIVRTYYSRKNWYDFEIKEFFYIIPILLLNTMAHTFITINWICVSISCISFLMILYIYRDLIALIFNNFFPLIVNRIKKNN